MTCFFTFNPIIGFTTYSSRAKRLVGISMLFQEITILSCFKCCFKSVRGFQQYAMIFSKNMQVCFIKKNSDAYFVTFLKKGKQASSLIAKFCLEKIGVNFFKFQSSCTKVFDRMLRFTCSGFFYRKLSCSLLNLYIVI